MSTTIDGEGKMAGQATKEKPEAPASKAAPEGAPAVTDAASAAAAMLEEVRAASRQMLEDAREQAAAIVSTAGDAVLTQERQLVEQAQKDFRAATGDGPGKVWLQHEVEPGFESVTFRARAGKKSELRMVRIGRYRYDVNGQERLSPGAAYQFSQGELVARSQDVADYVRSRPGFNVVFFEAGNEPGGAPDPGVMLDKVLEATLELDVERLEELRLEELARHKRPMVLERIESAKRKIHGRTQG